MPKSAPFGKRKKTKDLVNIYGFSLDTIRAMQDMTPYMPMDKLVDGWAKHLLAAESDFERKWHKSGEDIPLLEDFYKGTIRLCKPKALSYQIPGGRYSPDYLYIFDDGLRVSVEVKGSKYQKGYKDAIARMRVACTLHWYDRFMLVMWDKSGWQLEEMKPDKDYITELQMLANEVETMDTQIVEHEE